MAENYRDTIMPNIIQSYQKMGSKMSSRLDILTSTTHLDIFPPSIDTISDEHGERFHQNISFMKNRYRGKFQQHVSRLLLDTEKGLAKC